MAQSNKRRSKLLNQIEVLPPRLQELARNGKSDNWIAKQLQKHGAANREVRQTITK